MVLRGGACCCFSIYVAAYALHRTNFFTLHMRKGGGRYYGILIAQYRVSAPPSISVFLSLWEGGHSDGTLRYIYRKIAPVARLGGLAPARPTRKFSSKSMVKLDCYNLQRLPVTGQEHFHLLLKLAT